ncbi:MAG TPA: NAD(P)H-binding protein [Bryobacteraceae bacterium]|nr:NAD(P)H-binding protein [Bryobacteraceae bacterium]
MTNTHKLTYLITGATGDVGSKAVAHLLARGERPRVFVRDAAQARLRFGDGVDVFQGDFADPASLERALAGVDRLLLVTAGPRLGEWDAVAAHKAKAANVQLLVKLSSMDVEQGVAIGAWHELGERAVRAAGISFTFVRPTGFMSNLLAWAHSVQAEGVVRASTGDGGRAFIHSGDIAAVAVQALTTADYAGQALSITGPEALSFAAATARIGAALGKNLRFEAISDEEAGRRFADTGASPEETSAHVELWRAIREGRLATVTDTVERVLGRQPIPLDRWIAENLEAFR